MLFFFQAEDGIRDATVTGVQTCALPISVPLQAALERKRGLVVEQPLIDGIAAEQELARENRGVGTEIGRASCRERVEVRVVGVSVQDKLQRRYGIGI